MVTLTQRIEIIKELLRLAFDRRDWDNYDQLRAQYEVLQPRRTTEKWTGPTRDAAGIYHGTRH